jgi:hypothetical protein
MAASSKTPGPKPDFLVVDDHLKCQTSEGEISIDLRIPLKRLELFIDLPQLGIEQQHMPRYLLDNIIWPEDKDKIENMRDGATAFKILTKVAQTMGERMGADMGESQGSTGSSEDTVEPSDTTSGTPSA